MRIRDRRFHTPEETFREKAAHLLESLSEKAFWEPHASSLGDNIRRQQRQRDRFPDSYGNKPGAFIEKRCSPEQREVLRHLKSDENAFLPAFFRLILRHGHPDNKVGGVLEWEAPTIWTFSKG